jgi:hypothetical protein
MKRSLFAAFIGLGLITGLSFGLKAESPQTKPVVVELFTSQGCYSCPPAEAYLGELSKNPNIVALEFHVDYWDDLVYGSAGKWKDVFSKPEFTTRQRIYAGNLPEGQVYTPQMVVDGKSFAVGSRRGDVRRLIAEAKESRNNKAYQGTSVSISKQSQKGYVASINGHSDRPLSVWLVRFRKNVATRVRAGENKGKKLISHNIVTKVERLSAWNGSNAVVKFTVDGLKSSEGCAVLIQEDAQGPIYGAALYPDEMGAS